MKQRSHLAEEKCQTAGHSLLLVSQPTCLIQRQWLMFHLVKLSLIPVIFKQSHNRTEAVRNEKLELMGSSQRQNRQFFKKAVIKALLQTTSKWNKSRSELRAQLTKFSNLQQWLKKKRGTLTSLLSVISARIQRQNQKISQSNEKQ